ncbi:MAG TPA: winged helix-turn-helix domain-containing protein [Solirubrobacterales bacterium]|jgi:DNA-binding transcriptional ArsR family regulator|nr:winged helix-turn-helix domain-containing protein [Solirubrobacterales bacterium]
MVPGRRPDQIDSSLVRALAHPLRIEILQVLNEREASPNELMDLLEQPLGNVAYHSRVLEKCGCIEQVRTAQRRGAVEHYFRALPRSYIGHQDWRRVPRSVRPGITGASFESFVNRLIDSLQAGKIDDREDTTLNWMTMAVDELGWAQAAEVLNEALARLQSVHEQSRHRLAMTGGEATPMIVGLAAFEAATPEHHEPQP